MASTVTDRLAGVTAGLASKSPVRAATTSNITLSGEQTIDGVAVVADDRVLVKDQTDGIENGVWDAKSGAWVRSKDFDGTRDVVSGTFVVVASGGAAGTVRRLSTADPITIGTTSLTFTLMAIDGGTVSTFMAAVLDDTTALAARTTLGTMEIVNVVADHGAVGDGVTDDTLAIQAASDAGTDKTIFFPDGSYLCSALAVTKRQHWHLSPGTVLKLKANADVNFLTVDVDGWSMEGGKLDCNKANQGADKNGITINNDDVTIRRVEVRDAGNYGIVVRDCSHAVIDGCKVYDSDDIGIFAQVVTGGADEDNILITDCIVDRSGVAAATITNPGITVHGDDTTLKFFRAKIHGNYVKMPVSPTSNTAICIESFGLSRFSSITGNTTTGGSMGISIGKGDFATVAGNTVTNMNTIGIEAANGDNCVVAGNLIDGNAIGTKGVSISAATGTVLRVAVTGNTILGFKDRGVQASDALHLTISGNAIFMAVAPGWGIEILDSVHIAITGNDLHGNGAGERAVVLNKTDRLTISANNMFDFTAFGIELVAASAFTFTNIAINGNNFNTVTDPIGTSLSGGGALGSDIRAFGNTGLVRNSRKHNYFDILNDVIEAWHVGSPESNVVAGVGSIYHRTDGGAATSWYIKESGTGNTGWVAK